MEGIHRGRAKAVFCIEEQRWFKSLSDAAEWCGLGRKGGTNLGSAASGKRDTAGEHPITKEPLHWSFKEQSCSSIQKVTTTKAKAVEDITAGIIYPSMKTAMKEAPISQEALIRGCTLHIPVGKKKHKWRYVD